jgi:hypothetical protein
MLMNLPQRKRGSVAMRQADDDTGEKNWIGVFINDDSNPIKFGSQLWEELQDHWKCLNRFTSNLLDFSYWNEYKNGGLCLFCGKFGVGQPNAVTGRILKLVQENGPKSMAPDPKSIEHTHIRPQARIEAKNAKGDGLWIEWVYVIDPKTYSLEILKAVRAKGFNTVIREGKRWQQENYQYISVASVNLFCDEPKWDIIEKKGLNMAEYYFDKANEKVTFAEFGERRQRTFRPEGEN